MAINDLRDLYIHELKDLYSANSQSLEIHNKLCDACSNDEACSKMKRVIDGINDGISAVKSICERHSVSPDGEKCKGMGGLVTEAKAHALDADIDDDIVRDASIVSQSNRMEHYALAGYKSCLSYARALGLDDDAKTLQECVTGTESNGEALRSVIIESAKTVNS